MANMAQDVCNSLQAAVANDAAYTDLKARLNRTGAALSTFVQTYATATLTHSNPTATVLTDSSGGSANTTVQAIGGTYSQTEVANNFADVTAAINALIVDVANTKQVLNSVIDSLQAKEAA